MASEDVTQSTDSHPLCSFPSTSSLTYTEEVHPLRFKNRLVQFRRNGKYSDIIIKVGENRLACHKVVLAAYSPHLEALFQNTEEEDDFDILELRTSNQKVTETIIDFLYTGNIEITTDNVKAICESCDQLQLNELKRVADKFIAEKVEPANALGLYMFGKTYQLQLTQDAAFQCMLTKLSDILRLALDAEYKEFSKGALIEYIAQDNLEVDNEANVFELVKRWTEVDVRKREHEFEDVLEYVRLPLCTPTFLCKVVEECSFTDTKKCRKLIREAKNYHLLPETRHTDWSPRMNVRGKKHLIVLGGETLNRTSNTCCWSLKSGDNSWKQVADIPHKETHFMQACTVGRNIMISGGGRERLFEKPCGKCWLLCTADWTWKQMPSLHTPRAAHSMVAVRDRVYVCGGYTGDRGTDSCEMLDGLQQQWTEISPLCEPDHHTSHVAFNDSVHLLGGRCGPRNHQGLDVTINVWQKKAALPSDCCGAAAAVIQGKMYIAGGTSNVCMAYDAGMDSWSTLTIPLQTHTHMSAMTEWKGKVVLGGGEDTYTDYSDSVEEYDVVQNKWKKWSLCLPKKLRTHCLLTVLV